MSDLSIEELKLEVERLKRQCEWERVQKEANGGGMKVVMLRNERLKAQCDQLTAERAKAARLREALKSVFEWIDVPFGKVSTRHWEGLDRAREIIREEL